MRVLFSNLNRNQGYNPMNNVITRSISLSALWAFTTLSFAQYPEQWNLTNSINQAIRQAPLLQAFKTELDARQSQLDEAGNWPNPRIELAVDDAVSLEQGNSGYALSELSITQPLAFGRADSKKRQANNALSAAQHQQRFKILDVEKNTAHAFYSLQYQTDLLTLSKQRHDSLKKLLIRKKKSPLIRYFTKTERKRLDILREEAHQAVAAAEGEHREAITQFRTLLALPETYNPTLAALIPVTMPLSLEVFIASISQHPLLMSLQQSKMAAEASIEVARDGRRVYPELKLSSTRDVFAGREQTSTGVALMFEMPLWNSANSKVTRARAEFHQRQADYNTKRRDLNSQLRKSHLHMQHLLEQADHYSKRILTPAREILELSSRGFRSGEIDLLNFIDAHNTFYDAKSNYLRLVYEGWLETADVRYNAGEMLTEATP